MCIILDALERVVFCYIILKLKILTYFALILNIKALVGCYVDMLCTHNHDLNNSLKDFDLAFILLIPILYQDIIQQYPR